MKQIKKLFFDIVSDNREPDAKRVGGFIGWMTCVVISIVGVFIEIKSPYIVETLFWTSCILLGIDGIASMVTNRSISHKTTRTFGPPPQVEEEFNEEEIE